MKLNKGNKTVFILKTATESIYRCLSCNELTKSIWHWNCPNETEGQNDAEFNAELEKFKQCLK